MSRIRNGAEMQLTVPINMHDGYHNHAIGTHVVVEHSHLELDSEGFCPPAPAWLRVVTADGKVIGVAQHELEPRVIAQPIIAIIWSWVRKVVVRQPGSEAVE